MLILSRRPGDAILIDGGIRVVVLANEGGTVRLGIEAPDSVGIVREEIVNEITDENRRATASGAHAWAAKHPARPDAEPEGQPNARPDARPDARRPNPNRARLPKKLTGE